MFCLSQHASPLAVRYPPPAVAIPSPLAGSLVPGLPLPQACRLREITPPASLWLKPAGSPLTNARRPPLNLAPWIQSTRHGQENRVCVLLCPQEHFNPVMSCLVRGDSSGAGGSSCCGRGSHSSRLPPCRGSGCWGTLWGPLMSCHAQKKPQLPSLAQEGFLLLWAVLFLSV